MTTQFTLTNDEQRRVLTCIIQRKIQLESRIEEIENNNCEMSAINNKTKYAAIAVDSDRSELKELERIYEIFRFDKE